MIAPAVARRLRYVRIALSAAIGLAPMQPARADGPATSASAPTTDEDRRQLAEHAYDEGVRARAALDHAAAARHFARADELVPNPVALETAIRSAILADDAVFAMMLVERARREAARPESLGAAVDDARARFAGRVAYIEIACTACRATIDGAAVPAGSRAVVIPGRHAAILTAPPPAPETRLVVDVAAGETSMIRAEPAVASTPERARTPGRSDRGSASGGPPLSPPIFFAGVGATAVLGGVTIASTIDLFAKHRAFEREPTQANADAGASAQARTDALLVATAVVLVATAAIGVFATDWRHHRRGTSSRRALPRPPAPLPIE